MRKVSLHRLSLMAAVAEWSAVADFPLKLGGGRDLMKLRMLRNSQFRRFGDTAAPDDESDEGETAKVAVFAHVRNLMIWAQQGSASINSMP